MVIWIPLFLIELGTTKLSTKSSSKNKEMNLIKNRFEFYYATIRLIDRCERIGERIIEISERMDERIQKLIYRLKTRIDIIRDKIEKSPILG